MQTRKGELVDNVDKCTNKERGGGLVDNVDNKCNIHGIKRTRIYWKPSPLLYCKDMGGGGHRLSANIVNSSINKLRKKYSEYPMKTFTKHDSWWNSGWRNLAQNIMLRLSAWAEWKQRTMRHVGLLGKTSSGHWPYFCVDVTLTGNLEFEKCYNSLYFVMTTFKGRLLQIFGSAFINFLSEYIRTQSLTLNLREYFFKNPFLHVIWWMHTTIYHGIIYKCQHVQMVI